MRTATLNHGFCEMVQQIMWLMAQFYDRKRKALIVGLGGEQREVEMSPERLFLTGKKSGSLPPPPYMVQVQVQRRNPIRVQAQNELYMQAYGMAAQAGTAFPLSALFEMLNVDGKDKIMPVLRQNYAIMLKMEQLMQQNEQLAQIVQNLQGMNDKYAKAMSSGALGQGAPQGPQGEMMEGMQGGPMQGGMEEAMMGEMMGGMQGEMQDMMQEGPQGEPVLNENEMGLE